MGIDTQNKRRSVQGILPTPDSLISDGSDFRQVAGLYRGDFGGASPTILTSSSRCISTTSSNNIISLKKVSGAVISFGTAFNNSSSSQKSIFSQVISRASANSNTSSIKRNLSSILSVGASSSSVNSLKTVASSTVSVSTASSDTRTIKKVYSGSTGLCSTRSTVGATKTLTSNTASTGSSSSNLSVFKRITSSISAFTSSFSRANSSSSVNTVNNRRRSILGMGLSSDITYPAPDGTLSNHESDGSDFKHILGMYRGVLTQKFNSSVQSNGCSFAGEVRSYKILSSFAQSTGSAQSNISSQKRNISLISAISQASSNVSAINLKSSFVGSTTSGYSDILSRKIIQGIISSKGSTSSSVETRKLILGNVFGVGLASSNILSQKISSGAFDNRRRSILGMGLVSNRYYPGPDGSILDVNDDGSDFRHILGLYRGPYPVVYSSSAHGFGSSSSSFLTIKKLTSSISSRSLTSSSITGFTHQGYVPYYSRVLFPLIINRKEIFVGTINRDEIYASKIIQKILS